MGSIQLTGMASGLDTKAIVESMLQVEKTKVDRVNQDKQILEWRQEMYREMITKVRDFTKKYFDPLNKETYIMGSSALSGIKATTKTDSSVASVIAGSAAKPGNYELKVDQMAKSAKVTGSNIINQATVKGDLKIPIVVGENNDNITIDGQTIKIEQKGYESPSALAKEINAKIGSNETLKDKYTVQVSDKGELEVIKKLEIKDDNASVTINVNGESKSITLDKGNYTPDELASQINTKLKENMGDEYKDEYKFEVKDGQVTPSSSEVKITSSELKFTSAEVKMEDVTQKVTTNKLTYNKGFVKGKNSDLVISVRGKDPVIVDLSTVDTSKSNEEILQQISEEINKKSTDVTAEVVDGKLMFKTSSKEQIVISGNAANSIGIGNSLDITLDINKEKMANVLQFDNPSNKKVEFTINGQTFKYDFGSKTDSEDGYKGGQDLTIKQVFSDISSKAGVNISYNTISRSFSMESKQTGKEVNIEANDTSGKFLTSLFGSGSNLKAQGENAVVTFTDNEGNTNTFEYSSNNFTLSGISFDIKTMPTESIKIAVNTDTEKTVDLMKNFVKDFNEIMDELNTKTKERSNHKYKPLTEAQKEEMTEKEIELWEKKAKEGLLGNESEIEDFMYQLRNAVFLPVGGVNVNLKDIGFDTSNDYREGGKIQFDEDKFRKALAQDPQLISDLFTKTSDSGYETYDPNLTAEQRKAKNADQGILRRVNDVLNDFTRTTRNKDGKKGIFIEIAGIKGDTTVSENEISREIREKDKKIDSLNDLISQRENRYYKQFTRMESALSRLQSQSAIFAPPQ